MCVCVCAGVDQGRVEVETDLNLEVSFSEQALSYREGSKVAEEASCDTDDQLPVSSKIPNNYHQFIHTNLNPPTI